MFTGIITHVGKLKSLTQQANHDLLINIELENKKLNRNLDIGCSIACLGICLTLIDKLVTDKQINLIFQVSNETVNKTNINNWQIDKRINLEFSLRLQDELGGSLVSGHIDGTTSLKNLKKIDESWEFTFYLPKNYAKFICPKGSVVIEGVCLTVNQVGEDYFTTNIIPHSFKNTNLSELKIGDRVNLEFDMFARYINRIIELSHD